MFVICFYAVSHTDSFYQDFKKKKNQSNKGLTPVFPKEKFDIDKRYKLVRKGLISHLLKWCTIDGQFKWKHYHGFPRNVPFPCFVRCRYIVFSNINKDDFKS